MWFLGTKLEKELYGSFNVTDLVQRLLTHRCVTFFGRNDRYLLITEDNGYGGFTNIGTEEEKPPLILKNVLSYDEMKVKLLKLLINLILHCNNSLQSLSLLVVGPSLCKFF